MTLIREFWLLIGCMTALLLSGCGRAEESEAKNGSEKAGAPSVIFKAGRGLQFAPATIAALGIVTTEAKERSLSSETSLLAQVYEAGPPVLASALVAASDAEAMAGRNLAGAKLLRIDRAIEPATRQVEFIFALADQNHKVGDYVALALHSPAANVLAVPRSAVIDGASGTFVYVVNGGSYLRTLVKTGSADAEWMEIMDGLYAGDVVVNAAALKLWLTELRLTKGGGDTDG